MVYSIKFTFVLLICSSLGENQMSCLGTMMHETLFWSSNWPGGRQPDTARLICSFGRCQLHTELGLVQRHGALEIWWNIAIQQIPRDFFGRNSCWTDPSSFGAWKMGAEERGSRRGRCRGGPSPMSRRNWLHWRPEETGGNLILYSKLKQPINVTGGGKCGWLNSIQLDHRISVEPSHKPLGMAASHGLIDILHPWSKSF